MLAHFRACQHLPDRSGSPEEAFLKAHDLGRVGEREYLNTHGRTVRVTCRGLRDLDVIHNGLEDGAELFYEEMAGVPEDDLRRWLKPKDRLAVFAPVERREGGPNYMPRGIAEELERETGTRPDGTSGA